mmetsp:Transcript_92956/g.277421  ORF Transcript_92956/g.277421 Transcript_92956/m.277421 type:complete len:393 (+) Transcript_92956:129-1307(+)
MEGAASSASGQRRRSRSRGRAAAGGGKQDGKEKNGKAEEGKDPIAKHVGHLEVPHFNVVPGQLLGPGRRYMVRRLLGEGTFGRVLSCIDTVQREAVAVKVVKGVRRYCEYAEAEAEVLREISRCDPAGQSRCVRLRDAFLHPTHHYCLVFERLGVSLHEFMLKGCERGLLAADVRSIAQQLVQCLCFLHGLGLTHTDLKCRNLMLRNARYDLVPLPRAKGAEARKPHSNEVVVIDFGGALFAAERGDGKIGTRHYRPPEVIIGLPWDEKADLWSAGCIVALTYLGFRPIHAGEDLEQLALMEKLLGREFPRHMARGPCFSKGGRLEWPKRAPDHEAVERVERMRPLREQVSAHHAPLLQLLEGLLQLDPKKRLSAEAASELPLLAEDAALPE